jgi:hypothetical protein
VIHDDTEDMVHNVIYQYFQAADCGEAFELPPELIEEQLTVAVLITLEEERRMFPELVDALAISVVPPPPPRTPLARPCQEARVAWAANLSHA